MQKVPQWFGETVGFWNGNTLVAWTANVQGWTLSHSMFEFSNQMETIEVFTPSADGKTITVEATFYDPEAFTRPLHTVTPWEKHARLDDPEQRFTYVECRVQSTIVNGPDGRPTQMTSVDEGYIDYFGRPWAQNWEAKFEQGWKKPERAGGRGRRGKGRRMRNVVSGFSRTVGLVGLLLAGLTQSLVAHHSFAMYDMQKSQSMTGKLTRFIPGGNHAQLVFEVLGDDGKPMMKDGKVVVWGVETGSAANIAQERHHRGQLSGRHHHRRHAASTP